MFFDSVFKSPYPFAFLWLNRSGREGVVDVPGGCAAFLRQFFRATVFLSFFFSIHRCLFWVDFTNFCIFFAVYYVYFIKSQTVFWAQNFRDVQLFPNFLRYPAWLCIAAFGRHCCNKLPNRWILIQQ